jgi:hypothetical protein
MRATLPLMFAVSLAVHVMLAGGAALSGYHFAPPKSAERADENPTLTLIRPAPLPVRPLSAPAIVKAVDFHPVVMSQPAALPAISATPRAVAAPALIEKGLSVLTKTAPVTEPNPNAHLPKVAPEAVLSPVPPPNLDGTRGVVFILDISGSMYEPYAGSTRLAFARQTLSRQIRALKDGTPFAVTLYALRARNSGPLVAANDATREAAVRFIMRDVDCGGGTNLPAGLASAQQLHPGALVLATDGDLNISAFRLAARASDILGPQGHGPGLTIVGIAPRSAGRDLSRRAVRRQYRAPDFGCKVAGAQRLPFGPP